MTRIRRIAAWTLFAAIGIIAAGCASAPGQPATDLVVEEFMIPGADPGVQLYVRNKRPRDLTTFKLVNAEPKRLVIIGEGTHGVAMEKNRIQLFREVQMFMDEARN